MLQVIWNVDVLKNSIMEVKHKNTKIRPVDDDENHIVGDIIKVFDEAEALKLSLSGSFDKVDWPLLNANNLRREFFKYYYN